MAGIDAPKLLRQLSALWRRSRSFLAPTPLVILLCGCPPPAVEVGRDVCLTCHDGFLAPDTREFVNSAHGFMECESCHGPGLAHVRNAGVGGLFIRNPGREPFATHHTLCQRCHSGRTSEYVASEHALSRAVRCFDCHDVHTIAETTLPFRDNTLCLACHSFMEFPDVQAVVAHTFHSYGPEGIGTSRCTHCHMPPLRREDQEQGPHLHTMRPLEPITSNIAMEEGIFPAPPNSCAGIAGCHDGTIVGAPVFNVDNPAHNAILQIIYENRYGPE